MIDYPTYDFTTPRDPGPRLEQTLKTACDRARADSATKAQLRLWLADCAEHADQFHSIDGGEPSIITISIANPGDHDFYSSMAIHAELLAQLIRRRVTTNVAMNARSPIITFTSIFFLCLYLVSEIRILPVSAFAILCVMLVSRNMARPPANPGANPDFDAAGQTAYNEARQWQWSQLMYRLKATTMDNQQ